MLLVSCNIVYCHCITLTDILHKFIWCLLSRRVSHICLLPLGILSRGFKGRILKPGRPGGDLLLFMFTVYNPKWHKPHKNAPQRFNRFRQIWKNWKMPKTQWQLLIQFKLCPDLLNGSKATIKILYPQLNYQKSHKNVQNSQVHKSLSKTKFKFKPVTGSKQKHMAVSSIVGSTISLQYPLFQGLLIKEQLNWTLFMPDFCL